MAERSVSGTSLVGRVIDNLTRYFRKRKNDLDEPGTQIKRQRRQRQIAKIERSSRQVKRRKSGEPFQEGHPYTKVKHLNPMNYPLPSGQQLGAFEKFKAAFPYHPAWDVMQEHIERRLDDYKLNKLEKNLPLMEDVLGRFWRNKFRTFARSLYKDINSPLPKYKTDEQLMQDYPEIYKLWLLHKAKLILLESKRNRFGQSELDFGHYLQWKWMLDKKNEYVNRMTGLRFEPYFRRYVRSITLNEYHRAMLSCFHRSCWRIRLPQFHFIIFQFIKFAVWWRFNPELYDSR